MQEPTAARRPPWTRTQLSIWLGLDDPSIRRHRSVRASLIAGVLQNTLIPAVTTPRYKSVLESALMTIKEHEKHSEHLMHELG